MLLTTTCIAISLSTIILPPQLDWEYKLTIENLISDNLISNCQVYSHIEDGIDYAIKSRPFDRKENYDKGIKEIKITLFLSLLNRDLFVQFIVYQEHVNRLDMAMEYCINDAYQLIEKDTVTDNRDIMVFMEPVIQGLAIMHKNGISHGDIKPENVFYCGDKFKLSDFDLSTTIPEHNRFKGSPIFMAPEVVSILFTKWNYYDFEVFLLLI